uniref:BCL2 associated X, apoptosis regulator n=1 Tax=Haplochromis burtoni TaxID=8153 RepID=A0A3Q3CU65_HAPBU
TPMSPCMPRGPGWPNLPSLPGSPRLPSGPLFPVSPDMTLNGPALKVHLMQVQRMINDSSLCPTREVFMRVAYEIFSDGIFNWGREVALFYFACRLVIKALVTQIPDIIRTIISWTIDYLREHVINWIREQGGWEGIRSYFGTPTWQTVEVFLAGVLTTVLVIRKM